MDLDTFDRVSLVGAGKGAASMAKAALDLLRSRVSDGTLSIRDPISGGIPPLRIHVAGHPIPDAWSVAAAEDALGVAARAGPTDLLLCLISGGASALWACPPSGVELADYLDLSRSLIRSGATIHEINTVRRHLSRIAGGRLLRTTSAGRVLTLAVSDVSGSTPEAIGSGPTVQDPTTPADALVILQQLDLDVPPSIESFLREASQDAPSDRENLSSDRASFHVVASIEDAVEAAAEALESAGYQVDRQATWLEGEARDVAQTVVSEILRLRSSVTTPTAVIWGGETTVTVTGDGLGGRNQELALAAALHLEKLTGITIGAFATDGSDGPTAAAGGFADGGSVQRATEAGFDVAIALARNDAYPLLMASGDLIVTGPTGTNVNDLTMAIIEPLS